MSLAGPRHGDRLILALLGTSSEGLTVGVDRVNCRAVTGHQIDADIGRRNLLDERDELDGDAARLSNAAGVR